MVFQVLMIQMAQERLVRCLMIRIIAWKTLLKAVAQNSDNVATNILGYYVANQYDKAFQKSVDKAVSDLVEYG